MGPSSNAETVKVVVRCRPLNEKEITDGHQRIADVFPQRGVIEIRTSDFAETDPARSFTFDAVYDWDSTQVDLYAETVKPLVDSVLEGYNGTIFAYGQTGTGKTFTMEGVRNDTEKRGIIPRSFEQIFNHISCSRDKQFLVRASYLEIYQEQIRDLLAKDQKKRLELRERSDTGIYVKDLSSFVCKSVKEIEHVMNVGNQNRSVGATNMNEHSSRSHAIFIITVESCEIDVDGKNHIRVGRLNLVDLAGSERQSKTGAVGERLKEATKINLSLSALGNVISALVDGKNTHVPYRDSKLTRLLQDSLGGNSRTVMIANIGPASYNYEETMTTLRYASRAKHIKNKPQINEDPKDALLREFQEEIARLKANLANKKEKTKKKRSSFAGDEETEGEWKQQEVLLEEERRRLLQNTSMIADERDKLLHAVQEKEDEIKRQRDAQQKLQSRISALESKLLKGSQETNIEDLTREQQGAIENHRREILERQKLEREMQQQLEAQDEETLDLKETFTNLQQEVDIKTRKLKKLYDKWQSVKQEMSDLAAEFRAERQQLEEAQELLMKELRYKQMIITHFIPAEFKRKVLSRIKYDEEEEAWTLEPAAVQPHLEPPVADLAEVRPTSEYEKVARVEESHDFTRYRGENILLLHLDAPQRTTQDYISPGYSPSLQSALAEALKPDEGELEIKAPVKRVPDIHAFLKSACSRKAAQRLRCNRKPGSPLKSKRHPQSITPDGTAFNAYPKSRGLIPK